MKRRFYHLIVLATVMAGMAVACQKERPDGMLLVAEGFGDGKAAVEGPRTIRCASTAWTTEFSLTA